MHRFFFFFKQKTAYEVLRGRVGSEMCIRDRWDAEVAATAWAEQALVPVGILDMLDQAWRVEGDASETALDAVGSSHPDKLVAKAARKALFKFRSVG